MKSIHRVIRHMNICTSQQVIPLLMQPKQDTPILGEDDNTSGNLGPHEDEESTLVEQDIERNYRNLVGKSSDTGSHTRDGLSRRTPQARLLGSESSSSLREVRFSDQEFATGTSVSNINIITLDSKTINFFIIFMISLTMDKPNILQSLNLLKAT